MDKPRDASSQQFIQASSSLLRIGHAAETPSLKTAGSRKLEAWFLGPKAENADEFERLVVEAIRDHAYWRRNYHPEDPTHITETVKRTPEYLEAVDSLKEGFAGLLAFLKKSVPFFSMRYQGHMNWDLTIPGMLGYFSAMLYNPNNVAFEGSTATTILEQLVGDDLCRMLGYKVAVATNGNAKPSTPRPWGHITCDGSVANIESLWSARNLKFYALAMQDALKNEAALKPAASLEISLPDGTTGKFVELTTWQLLNLLADDVLAIPNRFSAEFGLDRQAITDSISPYSLQSLGIAGFARKYLAGIRDGRVFVPGTKHYSWPKAAAILGLGAANMISVAVDLDARLDIADLTTRLDECLANHVPVISVVAVIGSTEESAVDPLDEILKLRDAYAKRGLVFHVHADAAWGGYHRTVLNNYFPLPSPQNALTPAAPQPAAPLSEHTTRQLRRLDAADSITVDPHKSGYVPYPAGALCYRNSAMRNLVTFSAPVVFHGEAEPTVGIYGVEGSKPGASAAAVYLSHRVIRPDRNGYGKIIGQALFSCKRLYARLLTMAKPDDRFVVVPVPRTPAERQNLDEAKIRAELKDIHDLIDTRVNKDIESDAKAMRLLAEIGPDENILAYAFNFKNKDGGINSDLDMANKFNKAIYSRLSIKPGSDIYGYNMIVSTTDFDESAYGVKFMEDFKKRLCVTGPGKVVTVIRSVVMDPWVTDTVQGSFIDVLERELHKAVLDSLYAMTGSKARGY